MSIYDVNIKDQAFKLLPPFLRKIRIYSFLAVIIKGVEFTQAQFNTLRTDLELKLKYNSQKAYLQKYLNIIFDPSLERIEIVDGSFARDYFFTLAEAPLSPEAMTLMSETNTRETSLSSVLTESFGDYVVEAPDPLLTTLLSDRKINARIDFFNPAGKSYLITLPGAGLSSIGLAIGSGYNPSKDIYQ